MQTLASGDPHAACALPPLLAAGCWLLAAAGAARPVPSSSVPIAHGPTHGRSEDVRSMGFRVGPPRFKKGEVGSAMAANWLIGSCATGLEHARICLALSPLEIGAVSTSVPWLCRRLATLAAPCLLEKDGRRALRRIDVPLHVVSQVRMKTHPMYSI